MAKGFPYFKFIATEWLTGNIVFEDYELQGIFINICALYWHRDGKITFDDIKRRVKSDRIAELTDRFFSVNDGFISIKFLDEQLVAANHISQKNSDNGKKGGRPKALEKATAKRNKANESKEEEKEIKEEVKEIDYKALLENVKAKMIDDYILCETVCKNRGFSKGQYDFAVSDFLGTLPEPELEKEYSEIGRHFGNWCRNNERTILSKQIKPAKTAAKDDDWY